MNCFSYPLKVIPSYVSLTDPVSTIPSCIHLSYHCSFDKQKSKWSKKSGWYHVLVWTSEECFWPQSKLSSFSGLSIGFNGCLVGKECRSAIVTVFVQEQLSSKRIQFRIFQHCWIYINLTGGFSHSIELVCVVCKYVDWFSCVYCTCRSSTMLKSLSNELKTFDHS